MDWRGGGEIHGVDSELADVPMEFFLHVEFIKFSLWSIYTRGYNHPNGRRRADEESKAISQYEHSCCDSTAQLQPGRLLPSKPYGERVRINV
jgi:hypothetical protein